MRRNVEAACLIWAMLSFATTVHEPGLNLGWVLSGSFAMAIHSLLTERKP